MAYCKKLILFVLKLTSSSAIWVMIIMTFSGSKNSSSSGVNFNPFQS
eukprot:UN07812